MDKVIMMVPRVTVPNGTVFVPTKQTISIITISPSNDSKSSLTDGVDYAVPPRLCTGYTHAEGQRL